MHEVEFKWNAEVSRVMFVAMVGEGLVATTYLGRSGAWGGGGAAHEVSTAAAVEI